MDFIELKPTVLNVGEINELVTSSSCGAISLFIGTTRDNFENKRVVRLEYEAYEEMAKKEMKKICASARKEWPLCENIAIYHRLGLVPIKEASVIIAVASPHRKDAIQASEYLIDALKANVPIWKKEVYAEGDSSWKANKECSWNKENK